MTRRRGSACRGLAAACALALLLAGALLPVVRGGRVMLPDGSGGAAAATDRGGAPAQEPAGTGGDPVARSGRDGEGGSAGEAERDENRSPADRDAWTVSSREGTVEEAATDLLASYRDEGDCVLVRSGYLDLLGSVWGCVVRGGSWADVCLVVAGGDVAQVWVLRLDEAEVVSVLGGEGS